jgi:hypothetical protein
VDLMIDLREGIVELFDEAQRLVRPGRMLRSFLSCEELRLFKSAYQRRPERRKVKNEWRRRIDRELRAKRPVYAVTSLPVPQAHAGATLVRRCVTCGAAEELRHGIAHWQHITKFGVCAGG